MLREQFTAVNAYIKKVKAMKSNNPRFLSMKLEKKIEGIHIKQIEKKIIAITVENQIKTEK